MEALIMAINNTPAGDGIGSVLLSGLIALGVMALIYGVLELMNHVNKKKGGDDAGQQNTFVRKNNGSAFARVLADKIKKKNENETENNDRDMRA